MTRGAGSPSRHGRAAWLLAVAGSIAAATARADELALDPQASTLVFHLHNSLHMVHGRLGRGALEGRASIDASGAARVEVRARATGFTTANVNRDAHMYEVIEAARFPTIDLRALAEGARPESTPVEREGHAVARLQFHGKSADFPLTLRYAWSSPTRVRVRATFQVSLTQFGIPRPSLMFVAVDDQVTIEADLTWILSKSE